MWTMIKRDRDYDFDRGTKTIRFDDAEREKLRAVMRLVRMRYGNLADPSKLIKDLMGLTSNFNLTEAERALVRGKTVDSGPLHRHDPDAMVMGEVTTTPEAPKKPHKEQTGTDDPKR